MWTVALGAGLAFASAVLLQQLSQGGRRRRALGAAGQELDVAAKLGRESEVGQKLRSRAEKRVQEYLTEPGTDLVLRTVNVLPVVGLIVAFPIVWVRSGFAVAVLFSVLGAAAFFAGILSSKLLTWSVRRLIGVFKDWRR